MSYVLIMSNHTPINESEIHEKFTKIITKAEFIKIDPVCRELCAKYSNILPYLFDLAMDPSVVNAIGIIFYDHLIKFASNFIIFSIAPTSVDHCFAAFCLMRENYAKFEFNSLIPLYRWIENHIFLLPNGNRQQCYCMAFEALFAQSKFVECKLILCSMQENLDEMLPILEEREVAEAEIQYNKYIVRLKLVGSITSCLLSDQEIETASSCVDPISENIELLNNKAIRAIYRGHPEEALKFLEAIKNPPLNIVNNLVVTRLLIGRDRSVDLSNILSKSIIETYGSLFFDMETENGDVRRSLGVLRLFAKRYDSSLYFLFRSLRFNNPVDLLRIAEAISLSYDTTTWNLGKHFARGYIEPIFPPERRKKPNEIAFYFIRARDFERDQIKLGIAFELLLRAKALIDFGMEFCADGFLEYENDVHDHFADLKKWRDNYMEIKLTIMLQISYVALSLGFYVICRTMCKDVLSMDHIDVRTHQRFLACIYMAEVHLYYENNPKASFKAIEDAEGLLEQLKNEQLRPMQDVIWRELDFFQRFKQMDVILGHNRAFVMAACGRYQDAKNVFSKLKGSDDSNRKSCLDDISTAGFALTLEFFLDYQLAQNDEFMWLDLIRREGDFNVRKHE